MLKRLEPGGERRIFDYIADRFDECLYMYIDLGRYGLGGENISAWTDVDGAEVRAAAMTYYTGMHIFSREAGYRSSSLLELIRERRPEMVCARGDLVRALAPELAEYLPAYGGVGEIKRAADVDTSAVSALGPADFDGIAELMLSDEGLGGSYTRELLLRELNERRATGMGRHKGVRMDGMVVSHAATHAELEGLAVVSGFVTREGYRRRGLSLATVSALCRELLGEGRRVFSYYYVDAARALHERAGFTTAHEWGKLTRR